MTMRPCLDCGEPSAGPRCPEHTTRPHRVDRKPHAAARGYDHQWTLLSRRARRMQPWCTDCGGAEDLQGDHLPSAWERKAAGLPIRLQDVDVVCGHCNRARGAARGQKSNTTTRGAAPMHPSPDPHASRQSLSHTSRVAG